MHFVNLESFSEVDWQNPPTTSQPGLPFYLHQVLPPRIQTVQFICHWPSLRHSITVAIVDQSIYDSLSNCPAPRKSPTLEVYSSFGYILRKTCKLWPCVSLILAICSIWHSASRSDFTCQNDESDNRSSREVIGTCPGRGVLYIIVARHMLCNNGHAVQRVLGQLQSGCQAWYTCSGQISDKWWCSAYITLHR